MRLLHLGFSFGLRQDSSPGPVNQGLARYMRECRTSNAFAGVQWEIAIALDDLGYSPVAVAATPLINPKDIADPEGIMQRLRRPETDVERFIVEKLPQQIEEPDQLIPRLNDLLRDPSLYVGCRRAGLKLAKGSALDIPVESESRLNS